MLTVFERLCDQYKIVSVKPLLKGWSGDKKYILENSNERDQISELIIKSFISGIDNLSIFNEQ